MFFAKGSTIRFRRQGCCQRSSFQRCDSGTRYCAPAATPQKRKDGTGTPPRSRAGLRGSPVLCRDAPLAWCLFESLFLPLSRPVGLGLPDAEGLVAAACPRLLRGAKPSRRSPAGPSPAPAPPAPPALPAPFPKRLNPSPREATAFGAGSVRGDRGT